MLMSLWNLIVSSPLYLMLSTAFVCLLVALVVFMLINKRHQVQRFEQENQHQQAVLSLQHQGEMQHQNYTQLEAKLVQQESNQQEQQEKFQQQLSVYQDKLYKSERQLGEFQQQSKQLEDPKRRIAERTS